MQQASEARRVRPAGDGQLAWEPQFRTWLPDPPSVARAIAGTLSRALSVSNAIPAARCPLPRKRPPGTRPPGSPPASGTSQGISNRRKRKCQP